MIRAEGYNIVNLDSTLCLQEPKIKPFVPSMQEVIAKVLGLTVKDVSIKATTTENMGFVGREEGVVAYATVPLVKRWLTRFVYFSLPLISFPSLPLLTS